MECTLDKADVSLHCVFSSLSYATAPGFRVDRKHIRAAFPH